MKEVIIMSKNKSYRTSVVTLVPLMLVFVLMTTTSAQVRPAEKAKDAVKAAPAQDAANEDDEDEKLDASFRKFGQAAGAAYQCAGEGEKEKLVADVRKAYNRIGQLFGTERAFYFAASFGKATDDPFDKAKCAELMTKLRESILVKRAVAN